MTRWFSLEGTALVETFARWTKQIPKAVAVNDADLAESEHMIIGNGLHLAKVCLVAL
jgi:hypothetical protein